VTESADPLQRRHELTAGVRKGSDRAAILLVLLALNVVTGLGAIATEMLELRLLQRAVAGARISSEAFEVAGVLLGSAAIVQFLVYAATVVAWLAWMHRAYKNLRSVGTGKLEYSTGAAIGYWFIPLANLFLPYLVMSDLWQRSHGGNRPEEDSIRPRWLLGLWWVAWFATNVLMGLGNAAGLTSTDLVSQVAATGIWIWAYGGLVVAAVLAIFVVLRIERAQTALLDRPVDEPPPAERGFPV
jgi:hypothetical protein